MSNNINENNLELQYARLKGIDISKKIFSWWDIFLFILLFACSFCFMIGLSMFLIGGIGFFSNEPEIATETLGNNNGYWNIMNKYNNNFEEFYQYYQKYLSSDLNPTAYQKFAASGILLKDVYFVGLWLWVVPIIIFSSFSLIVLIIYMFWINGYIDKVGRYIFTKIQNINYKIDNYKPKSKEIDNNNQSTS